VIGMLTTLVFICMWWFLMCVYSVSSAYNANYLKIIPIYIFLFWFWERRKKIDFQIWKIPLKLYEFKS
jgi:hypothetical protein